MAISIHPSLSCLLPFYTIPIFPLLNQKIFHLLVGESVDSLCRDDTDAPIYSVIHFKTVLTFKRLDSKAFWIAYCVSGLVFYP